MDAPNTPEPLRRQADPAAATAGFEAIFRAAPSPFLVVTPPDYRIIAVNDEYLRATMTERAAILGRGLFEVFPDNPDAPSAEGPPGLRASLARVVAERRTDVMATVRYDIPRPAALGGGFEERWWSPRNAPVLGPDGAVACIIHHVEDVTARARAEAALRAAEHRFLALGTATSDVLYRMSADWSEMITLEGKEFIADTTERSRGWLEKYIPPDEQPRVRQAMREAIDGRRLFEMEHRVFRIDGSEGWVLSRAVPLLDETGGITEWFGAVADISERKRAEQELRASESKFRTLFESMDEGLCIVEMKFDEDGNALDYRFLEVNPAFEQQTGIADAVGRWMRQIAPRHEAYWFETYGRVATTGVPVRFQNRAEQLGRTYDVYAFRVGEPAARRVAILFDDITAREQAAEALRQSLAERDALLKELHHRVKNNLQVITSLLEMQARQTADRQALSALSEARNRMTAIAAIHELLYQSGSFSEVDLAAYARRLLRHVVSLHDSSSRIDASVAGDGIRVDLARAVPLGLLLNELVSNAYKHAFRARTHGELRVALDELDGQLRLCVTDDGAGLPDGFDERPHQTLGLQLVRMLAKQLGGAVTFRSDRGTRVEVRVPFRAQPG